MCSGSATRRSGRSRRTDGGRSSRHEDAPPRCLLDLPPSVRRERPERRVVFHCTCGEIVEVKAPSEVPTPPLSVVRRGAVMRRDQESSCRHCGSDFTLRERDLGTVCPQCLARVSNHANIAITAAADSRRVRSRARQARFRVRRVTTSRPSSAGTLEKAARLRLERRRCGGLWLAGPRRRRSRVSGAK